MARWAPVKHYITTGRTLKEASFVLLSRHGRIIGSIHMSQHPALLCRYNRKAARYARTL